MNTKQPQQPTKKLKQWEIDLLIKKLLLNLEG